MIIADIKEIAIPSIILDDCFFLFVLCNIFTILYKFKFTALIVSQLQHIINICSVLHFGGGKPPPYDMFHGKQSIQLSTGCS